MISTKITTFLLPGLVSRTRWKKQMPKTTRYALLTMIVTLVIVLAGSQVLFADDATGSTQVIQSLMQSPRLRGPERILQDFVDGESTTRVIVSLHRPAGANGLQDMKDLSVREQLAQEVSSACNNVLNRLDMDEIGITNRYNYLFGFSAEVSLEGLISLVDDPDIASIGKDEINKINLAQGIPLINATTVRSAYDGSGLSIAICDTGIDYTHPCLGNGGFPNAKVIGGYDTGQDDNDPIDANGHGTCCAGLAAGDTGTVGDYIGGVAPGAKLYALKITYTSTHGGAWVSDEIEAWDWCVAHQYDDPSNPIMIISMSFGGYYHTSSCDGEEPLMTTAASNAKAAGMTLFVSSGNDGYCDGTGFPACITHVISVGAVYDSNIGRYPQIGLVGCISNASCTGYTLNCPCTGFRKCYVDYTTAADQVTTYSNTANFLDVLAPSNAAYTTDIVGAGGYSAGNYYSRFGGTSAACPYVAGAAACLQVAADDVTGTYLTPDELQFLLTYTGDLITDPKVAITKPRVNLGKAVFCSSCNVWVDFNHSGTENGSYDHPYNTLAEAVTAASGGETICIKPGSSDETITITKVVTLGTCTGPVIIGP